MFNDHTAPSNRGVNSRVKFFLTSALPACAFLAVLYLIITGSPEQPVLDQQLPPHEVTQYYKQSTIQLIFGIFTIIVMIFSWLIAKTIDGRQKTAVKLAQTTEETNRANSAKSEFLARMSHDIRTPLTGMLGISEQLLESDLTPDQQDKVRIIHDSGTTLHNVINDILDLSKTEAGQLDIIPEPFRLRDLMSELIRILEPEAQAKNISFFCTYSKSLPEWIEADRIRLYQIIMTLISNAIRYTDKGEVEVQVTGKYQGDFFLLYISVRDSGSGIRDTEVKKVFTPFIAATEETTRAINSNNISLSIVKRLVQRMGGEIMVKSEYGVGTTFTFWSEAKVVEIAATPQHKQKEKKRRFRKQRSLQTNS